jgi:hypothetical protein
MSPWAAYSKLLGPEVKALDVDGRDGPAAQLEVEAKRATSTASCETAPAGPM